LVGAGRSELLETVFGLRPRTSGTVKSADHGELCMKFEYKSKDT
jgi:ABC-type sugar transport system ATPase subunit